MSLYHLILLAIIQGVTEFLPISSSGHLALAPHLLQETDQGLLIDIAAHIGTLFAVLIYFKQDTKALVSGSFDIINRKQTHDSRLCVWVIIATLPIVLAGYIMHCYFPEGIRSVEVIAWTTIIFGLVLGAVDKYFPKDVTLDKTSLKGFLFIGLAQVLSLIPGTSRSGITMTAGRALGLSRYEASRFSMILSIPTIMGAGTLGTLELIKRGSLTLTFDAVLVAVVSFGCALITLHLFINWIKKASFMPFVLYRVALGLFLLSYVYWF